MIEILLAVAQEGSEPLAHAWWLIGLALLFGLFMAGSIGVGFARGVGALNYRVLRDIAVSWVITLPAGAGLTVIFYFLLKWIFGG